MFTKLVSVAALNNSMDISHQTVDLSIPISFTEPQHCAVTVPGSSDLYVNKDSLPFVSLVSLFLLAGDYVALLPVFELSVDFLNIDPIIEVLQKVLDESSLTRTERRRLELDVLEIDKKELLLPVNTSSYTKEQRDVFYAFYILKQLTSNSTLNKKGEKWSTSLVNVSLGTLKLCGIFLVTQHHAGTSFTLVDNLFMSQEEKEGLEVKFPKYLGDIMDTGYRPFSAWIREAYGEDVPDSYLKMSQRVARSSTAFACDLHYMLPSSDLGSLWLLIAGFLENYQVNPEDGGIDYFDKVISFVEFILTRLATQQIERSPLKLGLLLAHKLLFSYMQVLYASESKVLPARDDLLFVSRSMAREEVSFPASTSTEDLVNCFMHCNLFGWLELLSISDQNRVVAFLDANPAHPAVKVLQDKISLSVSRMARLFNWKEFRTVPFPCLVALYKAGHADSKRLLTIFIAATTAKQGWKGAANSARMSSTRGLLRHLILRVPNMFNIFIRPLIHKESIKRLKVAEGSVLPVRVTERFDAMNDLLSARPATLSVFSMLTLQEWVFHHHTDSNHYRDNYIYLIFGKLGPAYRNINNHNIRVVLDVFRYYFENMNRQTIEMVMDLMPCLELVTVGYFLNQTSYNLFLSNLYMFKIKSYNFIHTLKSEADPLVDLTQRCRLEWVEIQNFLGTALHGSRNNPSPEVLSMFNVLCELVRHPAIRSQLFLIAFDLTRIKSLTGLSDPCVQLSKLCSSMALAPINGVSFRGLVLQGEHGDLPSSPFSFVSIAFIQDVLASMIHEEAFNEVGINELFDLLKTLLVDSSYLRQNMRNNDSFTEHVTDIVSFISSYIASADSFEITKGRLIGIMQAAFRTNLEELFYQIINSLIVISDDAIHSDYSIPAPLITIENETIASRFLTVIDSVIAFESQITPDEDISLDDEKYRMGDALTHLHNVTMNLHVTPDITGVSLRQVFDDAVEELMDQYRSLSGGEGPKSDFIAKWPNPETVTNVYAKVERSIESIGRILINSDSALGDDQRAHYKQALLEFFDVVSGFERLVSASTLGLTIQRNKTDFVMDRACVEDKDTKVQRKLKNRKDLFLYLLSCMVKLKESHRFSDLYHISKSLLPVGQVCSTGSYMAIRDLSMACEQEFGDGKSAVSLDEQDTNLAVTKTVSRVISESLKSGLSNPCVLAFIRKVIVSWIEETQRIVNNPNHQRLAHYVEMYRREQDDAGAGFLLAPTPEQQQLYDDYVAAMNRLRPLEYSFRLLLFSTVHRDEFVSAVLGEDVVDATIDSFFQVLTPEERLELKGGAMNVLVRQNLSLEVVVDTIRDKIYKDMEESTGGDDAFKFQSLASALGLELDEIVEFDNGAMSGVTPLVLIKILERYTHVRFESSEASKTERNEYVRLLEVCVVCGVFDVLDSVSIEAVFKRVLELHQKESRLLGKSSTSKGKEKMAGVVVDPHGYASDDEPIAPSSVHKRVPVPEPVTAEKRKRLN